MKQYNVTGMTCAACVARVEKAVTKVEGVTECSVSLLTNSMGVEGTAAEQDIIAAVEKAGYGASAKKNGGFRISFPTDNCSRL
jgi:Cu2+-exporting ATPase